MRPVETTYTNPGFGASSEGGVKADDTLSFENLGGGGPAPAGESVAEALADLVSSYVEPNFTPFLPSTALNFGGDVSPVMTLSSGSSPVTRTTSDSSSFMQKVPMWAWPVAALVVAVVIFKDKLFGKRKSLTARRR
jgi:hypothetical protein